MNTIIKKIDGHDSDKRIFEEAGEVIRKGGLVIFPTETVYGLGANALDADAVLKIFIAKGRPQDNPLIVHVYNFKQIETLVTEIPEEARIIAEKFWPGPLTMIFNKKDIIPDVTSAGLKSVGIRMPSLTSAREFIKYCGVPIAAPSANLSGKPSPTDAERCIEDMDGKIDYIIAGERCSVGVESTILDCTVKPFCILRPGGITLEMLREIDDKIYIDKAVMAKPSADLKPKAPGMKYRHYAPKAPVKIIRGDIKKTVEKINEMAQNYMKDNKKVGIIATDETIEFYPKNCIMSLGSRNNLETVASNLFETLRAIDDENVDIMLCEAFKEEGIGTAVMNRLKKSAGYDIINV